MAWKGGGWKVEVKVKVDDGLVVRTFEVGAPGRGTAATWQTRPLVLAFLAYCECFTDACPKHRGPCLRLQ